MQRVLHNATGTSATENLRSYNIITVSCNNTYMYFLSRGRTCHAHMRWSSAIIRCNTLIAIGWCQGSFRSQAWAPIRPTNLVDRQWRHFTASTGPCIYLMETSSTAVAALGRECRFWKGQADRFLCRGSPHSRLVGRLLLLLGLNLSMSKLSDEGAESGGREEEGRSRGRRREEKEGWEGWEEDSRRKMGLREMERE